MTTGKKVFIGVLITLVLLLCAGQAVLLVLSKEESAQIAGPHLTGFPISAQLAKSANLAIGGAPSRGVNDSGQPLRIINLYYFSDENLRQPLAVAGISVHFIQKVSMRFACDPPYNGYFVEVGGSPSGTEPKVTLGGKQIQVSKTDTEEDIYENLEDIKTRFRKSADNASPLDIEPSKMNPRTFVAQPSEVVRYVCVTPPPLFERDKFLDGIWYGTYAVWASSREAAEASITKFD